jgi:amidase
VRVPGNQFAYLEATVAELQAAMASGRLTARALTAAYLERIEALDRSGPQIRSVLELNPDALTIATACDQERVANGSRGPLHGIPVLVKDNIATADRMPTTAGSLALAGIVASRDAFVVSRLRDSGAVILGKANLSEWANIRSSHSTSGWSARGGLTRNPYALDRNASGSSSGSAAGIAANFAVVAVGTETDGSIVGPASVNGLVGLKPTVGLVSRNGVIPISRTQDTAGPMARTVADAAILLDAIAGPDPRDETTAGAPAVGYAEALDAGSLDGARLGVVRDQFGAHPGVDEVIGDALVTLRSHGAVLVDPVDFRLPDALSGSELEVLLTELGPGLQAWLAEFAPAAPVKTLRDVVVFNERHRDEEMPRFGQDLFEQSVARGGLDDPIYLEALLRCRRGARDDGIDAALQSHKLDALIAPTTGPAWLTDFVNGDRRTGSFARPAAVAGYPHLTVPAGDVHGLPIGLSFVGRPWSEPLLLSLGYSFELATRARRPPTFLPTLV